MITSQPPKRSSGRNLLIGALIVAAGAGGYLIRDQTQSASVGGEPQAGAGGQYGSGQGGSARGAGGRGGRGGANAIIPVQAVASRSGTLVAQRNAAGTVVPVNVSQVAAQTSGTVSKVIVKVGDAVKTNQPIVQLDDTQLKLTLQNAQLNLENAQINLKSQDTNTAQATGKLQQQLQAAQSALETANRSYTSTQQVYKVGGASKADLENAKTALDTAEANLSSAQSALSQNQRAGGEGLAQLRLAVSQAQIQLSQANLNLSNATLKAPFDGQITAVAAVQGQLVSPGAAAFSLASAAREIKFSVPPADATAFVPGRVFKFNTASQSFQVKVDALPAAPVAQNVPLLARVIGGAAPASGVVGTLNYGVNLAKGTIVPISSLQNDGTRTFVFEMIAGKSKAVTVNVLAQANSDAVVTGLEAGVQVIINPPPGLLDGAKVTTDATPTGAAGGQGGANAGGKNWAGGGGAQGGQAQPSSPSDASGAVGAAGGAAAGDGTAKPHHRRTQGQTGQAQPGQAQPGQAQGGAADGSSATPQAQPSGADQPSGKPAAQPSSAPAQPGGGQ